MLGTSIDMPENMFKNRLTVIRFSPTQALQNSLLHVARMCQPTAEHDHDHDDDGDNDSDDDNDGDDDAEEEDDSRTPATTGSTPPALGVLPV